MQTIEETLFTNRKTKEKMLHKQLTKYPFKHIVYRLMSPDFLNNCLTMEQIPLKAQSSDGLCFGPSYNYGYGLLRLRLRLRPMQTRWNFGDITFQHHNKNPLSIISM
jgi:hypothetical protein